MDRETEEEDLFSLSFSLPLESLRSISQNKLSIRRAEMTVTSSLLFHSVLFLDCFPNRIQTRLYTIAMRRMQVCALSNEEIIHLKLLLASSST